MGWQHHQQQHPQGQQQQQQQQQQSLRFAVHLEVLAAGSRTVQQRMHYIS
jgi:hypothetical protein